MTRIGKNNQGEIVDLDELPQFCTWSINNIKQARSILKLRYDDAPCTSETTQEMVDTLIQEFRNDPEQIERAILYHFKNLKK